jgi:hypothetical protein
MGDGPVVLAEQAVEDDCHAETSPFSEPDMLRLNTRVTNMIRGRFSTCWPIRQTARRSEDLIYDI